MKSISHVAVKSRCYPRSSGGFTLIEMLLVVAVIGILTSLVIAAVSNSTADARLVVARQQQAAVQEALNAWISSTSISSARTQYAAAATAGDKLNLVKGYLDTNARWMQEYTTDGSGNIQSPNMQSANVSMTFEAWTTSNYPSVKLLGL